VARKRQHPKKEIEDAIKYAEAHGWRVEVGGHHAWGKMYCPFNDKDCRCGVYCITSIASTPRDSDVHARKLYRVVDNCTTANKVAGATDLSMEKE
jgi:hypothetical protein